MSAGILEAPVASATTQPTLGPGTDGLDLAVLSDLTTVDRRLAHKDSVEQVFVTGVTRRGDDLLALGALPRAHHYFNDSTAEHHDPLLIAEFTRQAVEVFSHALLDVPLDSCFVLRSVDLEILDPAATRITPGPQPALVSLPVAQVRRNHDGVAYAAQGPVTCSVAGRPVARMHGTMAFMAAEVYRELRETTGRPSIQAPVGNALPCSPELVGRRLPGNVFISRPTGPARYASCLVVPRAHATWFDRPLDHYPGMLIAEAGRQLATVCLARETGLAVESIGIRRLALDFRAFAELDAPLELAVAAWEPLPHGAVVQIRARQDGRTTALLSYRLERRSNGGAA